jgi:soluble lytic murein transglycosylase
MNKSWERIIRDSYSKRWLVIAAMLFVVAAWQAPNAPAALQSTKRKAKKKSAPKPPPPKAVGAAGLIAVAQHELQLGHFDAAVEYATSAAGKAPSLSDYAHYVRAQAEYKLKNYSEVDKSVTQIFNQLPISPLTGAGAALAVNSDLDGDRPKNALELIKKYYDRIPQPNADLLFAKCFRANGDLAQAAEYYQRVYYGYPTASEAAIAATSLAEMKPKMGDAYPPVMPPAMLGRAEKLIRYHRPADARIELAAAIPQLGGEQRDLAQVRLGEVDYFAGNSKAAFEFLSALKVEDGEADAERVAYLVRCTRKLDKTADVTPFLQELEQHHANSSWRLDALMTVADQARTQNDLKTAMPLYRACATTFGRNPKAAFCNWRVAYDNYRNRTADAADSLKFYVQQFPESEDTTDALYFLARFYQQKNDDASARAAYDALVSHFPNTYFATLAVERLKEPAIKAAVPNPALQSWLHDVPWTKRDQFPSFKPGPVAQKRLDRAELLQLTGLTDWAEGELRFGARVDGEQNNVYALQLAKYAWARHAPDETLHYVKLYAPDYLYMPLDQAPLEFWQLAFPLPFRPAIETYSQQQNLDPFFVAALIRQESDFNIKEKSDANAYGLMQLVPATGRSMARHFGIRRLDTSQLVTADRNIQLGTYYLRTLANQFGGQMELALAAYNAGPGRAALWRSWGPFSEPAEQVEAIAFHETRLYVQIVLRNADIYRRLYAGTKADVPAYQPKPAPKTKPKAKRTLHS